MPGPGEQVPSARCAAGSVPGFRAARGTAFEVGGADSGIGNSPRCGHRWSMAGVAEIRERARRPDDVRSDPLATS